MKKVRCRHSLTIDDQTILVKHGVGELSNQTILALETVA